MLSGPLINFHFAGEDMNRTKYSIVNHAIQTLSICASTGWSLFAFSPKTKNCYKLGRHYERKLECDVSKLSLSYYCGLNV